MLFRSEKEILVEGEKKPPSEVVVTVSQPCRFGLETWACFRGRTPPSRFSFISIFFINFFNKLCLVARKGRKENNGVTILLIDLLVLNLILFSLIVRCKN